MSIAIIGGSGKMGRWLADFLVKDGKEVIITGRNELKLLEARQQLGVEVATIEVAVKKADAVLLSVPIDSFEQVVAQLGSFTQPEQVIIDITSVKEAPVELMHKYITKGTVLGAHPVFGSGARGVANQNFVLTPTSEAERALAEKVRQYLEARGAKVVLMNPREHDEIMTVVLGLAHFISIVSAEALAGFDTLLLMRTVGGTTYKVLLMLVESVISEDPELYATLQMNLPALTEVRARFRDSLKAWADLVENKDRQGFVERMTAIRDRMEKSNPDFGKAYENMYKIVEELNL